MKKSIIIFIGLIFINLNLLQSQKSNFDSGIDLFDTSEELVPLRKKSQTIGKC